VAEINELEKKANECWLKAEKEKELSDQPIMDSHLHTIEAIYSQNIALGYQNQIIIQNQKDILEYLEK